MTNKTVMIAIPAYEGKVNGHLLMALAELRRKREDVGILINEGRASLTLVRDEIVHTFLDHIQCHTLLMIDTDVICTDYHLEKMIDSSYGFVSACVPPRAGMDSTHGFNYTGELINWEDFKREEVVPARFLPCSMMKITRAALMKAKPFTVEYTVNGFRWNNFFPCGVVDGRMLTEAYYFSHIMRQAGNHAWIDFSVKVGHAK